MSLLAALDDDRTDERPSSSHLAAKDLKWIAVALLGMMAVLSPIYCSMKRRADKHVCVRNFNAINQAILGYSANHDNRLPPTFEDYGGAPLTEKGGAITWITQVSPYLTQRGSFLCPASEDTEAAQSLVQVPPEPGKGVPGELVSAVRPTTYGMYSAYSAYPIDAVAQPSQTAVVSETANRGARGSFDPMPLTGPDGNPARFDGPAIGWDTGNVAPDRTTKAVTRLAFYEVAGGEFKVDTKSRHEGGIHFLYLDGHYETLGPKSALVSTGPAGIQGRWQVPPTLVPTR